MTFQEFQANRIMMVIEYREFTDEWDKGADYLKAASGYRDEDLEFHKKCLWTDYVKSVFDEVCAAGMTVAEYESYWIKFDEFWTEIKASDKFTADEKTLESRTPILASHVCDLIIEEFDRRDALLSEQWEESCPERSLAV